MKAVLLPIIFICIPLVAIAQDDSSAEDPASKQVQSVEELSVPKPKPRLSGSLQSYMFLSQRTQMHQLDPGSYARQNLNVMPFYEIMTLRADNLGHPGLSVHLQGIAGLDLADVYFDNRFIADPVYAFVQFKHKIIDAKLGRQMVFAGAAEGLHIDGVRVALHTSLYLGVEGYAGLLVSPKQGPDWYQNERANDFDEFGRGFTDWKREGNYAVGGRLFYKVSDKTNAGVSLLHLARDSETATQILGADLDMTPISWMSIFGKANIDLTTLSVRDAGGYLDFFIGETSVVGLHYKHVDPTIYIANTSIFSVFSNEKHNALGASFGVTPFAQLSIDAFYSQLFYQYYDVDDTNDWETTTESGHQIDVDATYSFGEADHFGNARFGVGRIARAEAAVNQIRLGALIPLGATGLKSAVNAYVDVYQEPILEQNYALLGDVGIFYYTPRIRTGATFRAGETPYSDTELSGMITFAYNFLTTFSKQE
ncbi:MAG: hypothetical protein JXX29_23190 [Deltaproteobacteria bacterium]|nr:hypothetical protein [Deltaproteobacteria bacterium]MBN2674606.1 hypothetical protein [Deltaproteobacteria bacterium]